MAAEGTRLRGQGPSDWGKVIELYSFYNNPKGPDYGWMAANKSNMHSVFVITLNICLEFPQLIPKYLMC